MGLDLLCVTCCSAIFSIRDIMLKLISIGRLIRVRNAISWLGFSLYKNSLSSLSQPAGRSNARSSSEAR